MDSFSVGVALIAGHALRGTERGCLLPPSYTKPLPQLITPLPEDGPDQGMPLRMFAARTGAVENPRVAYQWPLARPHDWLVTACTDSALADLVLRCRALDSDCANLYDTHSHELANAAAAIWRPAVSHWGELYANGNHTDIYDYGHYVVEGLQHPADHGAALAHQWAIEQAVPSVELVLDMWQAFDQERRTALVQRIGSQLFRSVSVFIAQPRP